MEQDGGEAEAAPEETGRGRRGVRLRGERRAAGGEADGRRRPWPLIGAWALYLLVLAGGAAWLHAEGPIADTKGSRADSQQAGTDQAGEDRAGEDRAGEDRAGRDQGAGTMAGSDGDSQVPPPPSSQPEGAGQANAPGDAHGESVTAESGDGGTPGPPAADRSAAGADEAAGDGGAMAPKDGAPGQADRAALPANTPPPPMRVDPLRLAQSQAPLGPAPDPDLQEDSVDGILPRIGPEGRQPWQAYARPFEPVEGQPRIAVVFGALGLDSSITVRAIEDLPGQVTLAISPYASSLQDWVAQARGKGHEVLLALPVQPLGYPANDPGPHALLADQNTAEAASRLRWTLARAAGYAGLATEEESPVVENAKTAAPLLEALKERGLLFFDGSAASTVTAAELAQRDAVPFAAADIVIDEELTATGIDAALARLEELARQNGQAIGFAHGYPISIDRIAGWALSLRDKGIDLVPLTGTIPQSEGEKPESG